MNAVIDSKGDFIFVLVRPNYLGNIGSVARVLKNFGFERLRLVAPPKNYKDAEARKMAVGAFDILKNSQVYPTLADALLDVNLAIGSSCAQQRDIKPIPLVEMIPSIQKMAGNRIAFVFGDERNGLLREELERCHHIAMVPTAAHFPSLNVAQAVGIFAYELSKLRLHGSAGIDAAPADAAIEQRNELVLTTGAEDDELFEHIDSLLDQVGFTRKYNRNNIKTELRSLYQRSHPTERELDLLKGALRKIEQKLRRTSQ